MGYAISPLIANLFMEEFEVKVLISFPHPLNLWLSFVDDTFVITKAEHSQLLLQHINSQDADNPVYSWRSIITGHTPIFGHLSHHRIQQHLQHNSLQKTYTYRPILHWDSNHFTAAKQSVYGTLAHRAKIISSNQETLNQEFQHIRRALQAFQFAHWTLNQLQHKFERNHHSNQDSNHNSNSTHTDNSINNNRNITIVVPYIQGTGERFKTVFKAKGIQVHFKGTNTPRTLLITPKDKDKKFHKIGVIYYFKCPHINFPDEYRWIWQGTGRKDQGTFQGSISHSPA